MALGKCSQLGGWWVNHSGDGQMVGHVRQMLGYFGQTLGHGEPWTLWELDEALYDCVGDYYKSNNGKDGVELHENDSGVLSNYYDK